LKENFVLVYVPHGQSDLEILKNLLRDFFFDADTLLRINKLTPIHTRVILALPKKTPSELMTLKQRLAAYCIQHHVDAALIAEKNFMTKKRLAVFDMDSTLIQAEVIDEMATLHGVGDKVKLITSRAMKGEIQFDQSLTERVALMKGFYRKQMEGLYSQIELMDGAFELMQSLKSQGIKTAIVSGGFHFFAENFRQKLGMDYVYANDLEFAQNQLTGKIQGPLINAEAKSRLLQEIAKKENVSLDEVIAVGDGANDIPMLLTAGMGIAFHAKEKVRNAASFQINHGPMTTLLAYMD
jgi:phosphoserine phosphatase